MSIFLRSWQEQAYQTIMTEINANHELTKMTIMVRWCDGMSMFPSPMDLLDPLEAEVMCVNKLDVIPDGALLRDKPAL